MDHFAANVCGIICEHCGTLPDQPYRHTRVTVCPQINATRTRASISNLGTHSPPFFEFERVFATRATRVYVPALHGHLRPARSTTSQAMLGAQSALLTTPNTNGGGLWHVRCRFGLGTFLLWIWCVSVHARELIFL